MEQKTVGLWFESIQGMSEGRRVHLGHSASWIPEERCALVEQWGPGGRDEKRIPLPEELQSQGAVILYLYSHGVHVPDEALRRARQEQGPAAGALRLEDAELHSWPGQEAQLQLSAQGRILECAFSRTRRRLPGTLARALMDAQAGGSVALYRWDRAPGLEIEAGGLALTVKAEGRYITCFRDDKLVADLERLDPEEFREDAALGTLCGWAIFEEPLPEETMLAALAAPLLGLFPGGKDLRQHAGIIRIGAGLEQVGHFRDRLLNRSQGEIRRDALQRVSRLKRAGQVMRLHGFLQLVKGRFLHHLVHQAEIERFVVHAPSQALFGIRAPGTEIVDRQHLPEPPFYSDRIISHSAEKGKTVPACARIVPRNREKSR